jgi:predicted SPOUT superfamily RNA methylase MTH1
MLTNLQYIETPQYLRKMLFPKSDSLVNSGLMNPLNADHHLRIDEWCSYREGCVLNRTTNGKGSWVNIGLKKECKITENLEPNTRVTIKLNEKGFDEKLKNYSGEVCSMQEPKQQLGLYWGYSIRIVDKFSEIFENCIYEDGYDLLIGTSDKGKDYREESFEGFEHFNHALLIFGGLQGIEGMVEADEKYDVKNIPSIFNFYVNTCPSQGLRTIRTEEALLITLSVLKPKLENLKI